MPTFLEKALERMEWTSFSKSGDGRRSKNNASKSYVPILRYRTNCWKNRIFAAKKNNLSNFLHDRRLVQGERALLEKGDAGITKMRKDFEKDRYDTIVGIDPGQKNPVTTVKYTKIAEEHLRRDPDDTDACPRPFDPGGSN